jgi:hypothetical protein
MTWQPIETAPKDGTKLLLFYPNLNYPIRLGHYSKSEHREHDKITYQNEGWVAGGFSFGRKDPVPSHWMPLPGPPPL